MRFLPRCTCTVRVPRRLYGRQEHVCRRLGARGRRCTRQTGQKVKSKQRCMRENTNKGTVFKPQLYKCSTVQVV